MFKKFKIPDATIGRLSLYSRYLIEADEKVLMFMFVMVQTSIN
jgi:NADH/NAD ratio-sensing transcriptional regulator Rex